MTPRSSIRTLSLLLALLSALGGPPAAAQAPPATGPSLPAPAPSPPASGQSPPASDPSLPAADPGPTATPDAPGWALNDRDLRTQRIEDVPLESLLEPVVAASKYEQKQEHAPSSVTVVTAEEIARYGYRTLGEILSSVAGAFTTDDRNYSYLALRGFGIPGDYNSRVLLLVNGQRYNDAIYNTAAVGREFAIDVELIERVELIRGPGSSLYGSNAVFGVVNVITKNGAADRGLAASLAAGSLGTYRAGATYGDRFGGERGLDLRLAASYEQRAGNRFLFYKEFDDPATLNGIARDLDAEDVARFFGSAAYRGLTAQGAFVVRRKDVPTAAFGSLFGDPRFYSLDASGFAVLEYRHTLPAKVELSGRASFASYRYEGEYPYDYREAETDPPLLAVNRDEVAGSWWGAELLLSRSFRERVKATLGGEFRHELIQDQANFDKDPREVYVDSRESTKVGGVYGQVDWTVLRELLLLSGGVRYDHYSGGIGGAVSPRGALIITPPSRTAVKLLFGTAFRAPNAYERFYSWGDPALGSAQLVNPDLGPERIQTYEAVVEQYVGGHVRAALSGYYYRIDDLIRLEAVDELDNLRFENVAEVDALGLEVALEARGWRRVLARASYALQRARDRQTDEELVNSPAHLLKLLLSVPLWRDKLFLSGVVRYMTGRRVVDGSELRGHVLADVTLLTRELPRGLSLALSVKNLFDARWFDPGSEEHLQRAIQQNGRTFFVQATYRPDFRRQP